MCDNRKWRKAAIRYSAEIADNSAASRLGIAANHIATGAASKLSLNTLVR